MSRALLLAGAAPFALLAAPVLAQEAPAPATAEAESVSASDSESAGGNAIIVTARRRQENVQTVPLAISVVEAAKLDAQGTYNIARLTQIQPTLQFYSQNPRNTFINIRGIGAPFGLTNDGFEQGVGIYIDDVYYNRIASATLDFVDVEQIETLRGPQGTLYGKNTTGGAVNIISRDAKLGETSGYLNAGYGNYNRVDVNGAVNVPLGDKAALRVAGTFSRADGWFKNVVPGLPDLASTREYALRGTLKFEPTDSVRFTLRASTSFQNPQNYGIYAQPEAVQRPGLSKWEIASDVSQRRRARTTSVALTTNIDVSDTLAITSITSYDKGTLFFREDTDGTATKLLEIPYYDRASQFAQDLRLTSDTGGPFDFILGAYFNREKVYNETTFEIATDVDVNGDGFINAQDCADGLPLACKVKTQFTQIKKSFALYSDLKYKLTDALTVRGGLRYTHDTGVQSGFRSDALGVDNSLVATLIPPSALRYKNNNVSGKIGFDYKLASGDLLYASFSKGYRAPSFNAQAFFDPSELSVAKAEKVTSYEVGAKTQFWDRRVTLNMAAFYYDYRNQQFINVDPTTAAQTLLNIPKSRIYGAEAELTVRPTDTFTFHGGLGLLSTKIIRGDVSGTDVSGRRLSNAPSLTFNAGIDFTVFKNDALTFSIHPDLSYQSNQFFEVINVPRLRQSSYALVGGHVDLETADGRYSLSVWAKNLGNKFYFTSRVDLLAGFGFDYNHIGNPRTFGVTLGAKF